MNAAPDMITTGLKMTVALGDGFGLDGIPALWVEAIGRSAVGARGWKAHSRVGESLPGRKKEHRVGSGAGKSAGPWPVCRSGQPFGHD